MPIWSCFERYFVCVVFAKLLKSRGAAVCSCWLTLCITYSERASPVHRHILRCPNSGTHLPADDARISSTPPQKKAVNFRKVASKYCILNHFRFSACQVVLWTCPLGFSQASALPEFRAAAMMCPNFGHDQKK